MLHQRVLRLGQDRNQRVFVQVFERRNNRQAANKLRDQAEFQQILRFEVFEVLTHSLLAFVFDVSPKAHRRSLATLRNDLIKAGKSPAADEQNVGCVHLQKLLLWMLAPTLGWYRRNCTFHDLQQGLLHALTRHIAGY